MGANLETFSYAMGGSVRQVKWPVATMCFLLSQDASFITSRDLPVLVDGGYMSMSAEGL